MERNSASSYSRVLLRLLAISIFATGCFAPSLAAQKEFIPTAAAKAEFDKGMAAWGNNWKAAAAHFRRAIALDPDYYEAYEDYMISSTKAAAEKLPTPAAKEQAAKKAAQLLIALYKRRARQHPKDPVYPWALGDYYEESDPALATNYFHLALKLDPHYAPAYEDLGGMADSRGNLVLSREDLRKAHEFWPDNASFWEVYAGSWASSDPIKAEQIALQMLAKFPQQALDVLNSLAAVEDPDSKRAREIEDLLWRKYPKQPDAGGWGLWPLFNFYMKSDPAKALDLATVMVKNNPKDDTWPSLRNYARAIIKANGLIANHKPAEALGFLAKVKFPNYAADSDVLEITRARAVSAEGKPSAAYADLVADYAKAPTRTLHAALSSQGSKLGKTEQQVEADVWARRSSDAKPGIPFTLTSFTTGKPVSLVDYKGKVFLLSFFFPECGPCHFEFPFLQQVLNKYKDRGFSILAVNGVPKQNSMVLPLFQGLGLGFLPLKGNDAILKAYKVFAFPTNFLYGADGRIYFNPRVEGAASERHLELEVAALLRHTKHPVPIRQRKSSNPDGQQSHTSGLSGVR
jgi:thiol-disulfide isomerase/thioredoxin/Tfp pilus assembly protein PilF